MQKMPAENIDMKNWYISNFDVFESQLNGSGALPFHETRKDAMSKFSQMQFPTLKNEEWKYTNVAPLLKHKFALAKEPVALKQATLKPFLFDGLEQNLLVFVNGQYSESLSNVKPQIKGLIVDSLANALSSNTDLTGKYLAKYAGYESEVFTALNTAFAMDGAFVFIPRGAVVETPIHVLHITNHSDKEYLSHPRNLFVAGENSKAQIIESFYSLSDATYFNNVVSEIVLHANANIEHYKIQNESRRAFHIETRQVQLNRDSVYTSIGIDLGGALVRNNLNAVLDGENSHASLYGFYFGIDDQLIDNHTLMDHAKPHCQSNELYKGILDDRAKGVFNGKVMVRKDAQKTNAFQENKTLLLTDGATINSKPQLEIFADDVKCSHGATIGQLDEEALFYLRSRGIGQAQANAMLRYAFASDIFNDIKIAPVRDHLEKMILECFERSHNG